jgi:hypothetical protein
MAAQVVSIGSAGYQEPRDEASTVCCSMVSLKEIQHLEGGVPKVELTDPIRQCPSHSKRMKRQSLPKNADVVSLSGKMVGPILEPDLGAQIVFAIALYILVH